MEHVFRCSQHSMHWLTEVERESNHLWGIGGDWGNASNCMGVAEETG